MIHALAAAGSRGLLCALALFGLASHGWLLRGGTVPDWLLPVCLIGGVAAEFVFANRASLEIDTTRRWLTITAAIVVAAVIASLAVGMTTAPRAWDGFVSWDLRAQALTEHPGLDQPFFSDVGVFSHSRDYPLLQPLGIASLNRIGLPGRFFPLLVFVAWLGLIATSLRDLGVSSLVRTLCVVGAATTPMLVNPSAGAVDSGYGEMLLLFGVTAGAAGLATKCRRVLFYGAAVMVLAKPEGMIYGLLPVVIALCTREGLRVAGFGLIGWAFAAGILIPLQQILQTPGTEPNAMWLWLGLLFGGGALLAIDRLLKRRSTPARTRMIIVLGLGPALLLTVPLVAVWSGNSAGIFGVYLTDLSRPFQRLDRLGPILLGQLQAMVHVRRFALLFPLALLACWAAGRTRHERSWALTALLLTGLLCVVTAFLLSPEENLRHHLRSSMTRLLLHHVGVAWLLLGVSVRHGFLLSNRDHDTAMT